MKLTAKDRERLDSLEPGVGLYFERQLEYINSEVLRAKRPSLSGLSLFPVKVIDEGATSYSRVMYEHHGSHAEFIANYADDLKRVDVTAKKEEIPIKLFGKSFGYSIDDIAKSHYASRSGIGPSVNLPTEKALAARAYIELTLNHITWYGASDENLYGVLNHPYIPRRAMPTALTGAVDTLASDITAAFYSVLDQSTQVEVPNRILMAAQARNSLACRYRTNTDLTLLDMVAASCNISKEQIIGVHELDFAGENGGHLMIIDRRDHLVMEHVIPTAFQQLPPQERNLEFVINCIGRSGGMMSMYPLGMRICEFPA